MKSRSKIERKRKENKYTQLENENLYTKINKVRKRERQKERKTE
jgi:hypothetical protein